MSFHLIADTVGAVTVGLFVTGAGFDGAVGVAAGVDGFVGVGLVVVVPTPPPPPPPQLIMKAAIPTRIELFLKLYFFKTSFISLLI